MHSLRTFYRPDRYPQWIPWKDFHGEFTIIGQAGSLSIGGVPSARAGFAPRISFGKPPFFCDPTTGRNTRRGFEFQTRFQGLGHATLQKFRIHGQKLIEKSTSLPRIT